MYMQLFFVTRCDVIKFIPMFTVVVINHNCHNLFRKRVVVSIRSICIKLWCFISPLQCLRHSFDLWRLYLKESTNYQDPHLLLNIPMMTLWCLSSQQCRLKYVGKYYTCSWNYRHDRCNLLYLYLFPKKWYHFGLT